MRTVQGDSGDYLELRVGANSDYLLIVLLVGGGEIEAEDSDKSDEQREYSTYLQVLRIIERVTGWRADPDGEAELLFNARECGVGPGGEVTRTKAISDDQLAQSMIALAQRSLPAVERPRPPALLHSPALDELLQLIQSAVPRELTPWRRSYLPSAGSFATIVDDAHVPGDPDPLESDRGRQAQLGFRLHAELGDDATGRPVEIDIVLDTDHVARATIRFDTLPRHGSDTFLYAAPWESDIRAIAARDPDWVPAWAHEAIELFRDAGRDISAGSPAASPARGGRFRRLFRRS